MSLTSHLKDPASPIGSYIRSRFGNTSAISRPANAQLKAASAILPVSTVAYPYGIMGTAVDYRLRYYLEVTPSDSLIAYVGAARLTKLLPCCLSVKDSTVIRQFGNVLMSVTLPESWREAVADLSRESGSDDSHERVEARRAELEAERKRLVGVFA